MKKNKCSDALPFPPLLNMWLVQINYKLAIYYRFSQIDLEFTKTSPNKFFEQK